MNNIKLWFDNILKKDLVYKAMINNSYDIPKIDNVNININLKTAIENPKTVSYAIIMLKIITNQKPCICRARKSLAAFKIRKGMIVGSKVSLRKKSAFNFLNILILLTLAKLKKQKSYKVNNQGNLSLGIDNLFIFPQFMDIYEKFPKNISCIINIKLLKSNIDISNLVFSGLQIPINSSFSKK